MCRNFSDLVLDRVGIQFQTTVFQEPRQTRPMRQGISDVFGRSSEKVQCQIDQLELALENLQTDRAADATEEGDETDDQAGADNKQDKKKMRSQEAAGSSATGTQRARSRRCLSGLRW